MDQGLRTGLKGCARCIRQNPFKPARLAYYLSSPLPARNHPILPAHIFNIFKEFKAACIPHTEIIYPTILQPIS